jgi:hypothetical protein
MPAGVFTAHPVAANDPCYAGASTIARDTSVVAPRHAVGEAPGTEDGLPFRTATLPTADDIRHATELRLKIRLRYLARVAPAAGPWSVGVD